MAALLSQFTRISAILLVLLAAFVIDSTSSLDLDSALDLSPEFLYNSTSIELQDDFPSLNYSLAHHSHSNSTTVGKSRPKRQATLAAAIIAALLGNAFLNNNLPLGPIGPPPPLGPPGPIVVIGATVTAHNSGYFRQVKAALLDTSNFLRRKRRQTSSQVGNQVVSTGQAPFLGPGTFLTDTQRRFAQLNSNEVDARRLQRSGRLRRFPALSQNIRVNSAGVTCADICTQTPGTTGFALIGFCTNMYCQCGTGLDPDPALQIENLQNALSAAQNRQDGGDNSRGHSQIATRRQDFTRLRNLRKNLMVRCPRDLVFDPDHCRCDQPSRVPLCSDDLLLDDGVPAIAGGANLGVGRPAGANFGGARPGGQGFGGGRPGFGGGRPAGPNFINGVGNVAVVPVNNGVGGGNFGRGVGGGFGAGAGFGTGGGGFGAGAGFGTGGGNFGAGGGFGVGGNVF